MKYSIDTSRLYMKEGPISYVTRVRIKMKEEVDAAVLRKAINEAIKRYPYFAVRVTLDEDGAFVLKPNPRDIVVFPVARKPRKACSDEVNEHMVFAEYEGKEIFLNISHALCGGRGAMPFVMTTIYQYVKDKYNVEPNAPSIRKPGEPLLEGETQEPSLDLLSNEAPIYTAKSKNPVIMLFDYMNGFYNPFMRNPNYYFYTFDQKDIMTFARNNDASVASFFMVAVAKALDKVLPEKNKVIGGEIAHCPVEDMGLKNTYHDILSHIYVDYERDQLKMDMEKLGTMTRGQIILQSDYSVVSKELRKIFETFEAMEQIKGLKNKIKYYKKHNLSRGEDARHGTYIVNYTGRCDWGEVADYVESYGAIVEGHILLEVTSMADKIFVTFTQLLKTDKYTNAFEEVMRELNIPFSVEGPFPKHMSMHQLPKK